MPHQIKWHSLAVMKANARVDKNGCWVWQGRVDKDGYGRFKHRCKPVVAHRLAWEFKYKMKVPKGVLVCHHCDNPPCINPKHLFLGTVKTNAIDMVAKGRAHHPNGELQGSSKLTEADVRDIRVRVQGGEMQSVLAAEYNVSRANVCMIVARKTWFHIN